MFQFRQIDPNIQDALFDRIDALNRTGKFSSPLSPIASRNKSMEEMLTKSTWASVTSAVYDDKYKFDPNDPKKHLVRMTSGLTRDDQPIGSPITTKDDFGNPKDSDLHRPHSGIQSISTSFKSHSTQYVTINWKFWDIREFDYYKEAFLKHGRMVLVEFGWAKNKKINLEHQTVKKPDEMLEVYQSLQKQIQTAGGDYNAVIGQIKNFNYKINPGGGFDCTTELVSMGSTIFKGQIDPAPDSKLPEAIIENNDTKQEDVMKNSNFYFEKFIENLDKHIKVATERGQGGVYHNGKEGEDAGAWCNWGWFEDIVLNTFFGFTTTMEAGSDKPMKTFIESRDIRYEIDKNSKIQSSTPSETLCRNSKNLYTNTIDIVFPGQTIGMDGDVAGLSKMEEGDSKDYFVQLLNDFNKINEMPLFATEAVVQTTGPAGEEIIENKKGQWYYHPNGDTSQSVLVDPPPKVPEQRGTIRHMVFSSKFLKDSFSGGVRDLGGAVISFFNRVSSQYGGYWNFDVVNSLENTGQIGIIDKYTTESRVKSVNPDGLFIEKSKKDQLGTFVFSNYGKNSLVRDFDIEVKLTAAQTTMAALHANKDAKAKPGGTNKPEDMGVRALSVLQNVQISEQTNDTDPDSTEGMEDQIINKITFPFLENMIMGYNTPSDQHSGTSLHTVGEFEKIQKDEVAKVIEGKEKLEMNEKFVNDEAGNYRQWKKDDSGNPIGLLWDTKGHMIISYNRLMLYMLNNSEPAKKEVDPLVPLGCTFTISGIAGIRMYDIFAIDYLPETYRRFAVFQVIGMDHTLDESGWSTQISGQMRIDMDSLTDAHGKLFTPKVIEIVNTTNKDFGQVYNEAQTEVESSKENESDGSGTSPGDGNSAAVSEKGAQLEVSQADWQKGELTKSEEHARTLYQAMRGGTGIGTDEDAILGVYEHPTKSWTLNFDNQEAIKAAYWEYVGKEKTMFGNDKDLKWAIGKDFDGADEKRILKLAGY